MRLIAFDVPGSGLPVRLRNKKTQKGGYIQESGIGLMFQWRQY